MADPARDPLTRIAEALERLVELEEQESERRKNPRKRSRKTPSPPDPDTSRKVAQMLRRKGLA